jgi:hypothetical protein
MKSIHTGFTIPAAAVPEEEIGRGTSYLELSGILRHSQSGAGIRNVTT